MKKTAAILTAALCGLCVSAAPGPRGEMISFDMDSSAVYPGTVRKIDVYVPEQYKGDKPACLIVRMDGIGHGLPEIIDELVDEGSMPVTIAVFINPGKVIGEDGEVLRYNRSNEYDRMTGTWAGFIENEVLPAVGRLTTKDGRRILVSDNPDDRAITGDSSGGIAAFTAAWQRPDLFHRVYSIVGTFVPFRGGDSYPALIRKTEPKPLRICLQDNDEDSWNRIFGSWYEYNLNMASALSFAGYDMLTFWDKGGHSGDNGGKRMKEVMRWLWASWPEPVRARQGGNDLIGSILIEGEDWVETDSMKGAVRHEALYPGGKLLAYPKAGTNAICTYIVDKDGGLSFGEEFYWLHNEGCEDNSERCLAFDTDGWLYASSGLGIQVCDQNGRVRAIIPVPYGKFTDFSFLGNDLYVKVDGRYYVRHVGHTASDKSSPRPKSQGQG